jgi:large subunit ribosomal protein L18
MAVPKVLARQKRKKRIKAKVGGTANRPRIAVFRSNNNIFAQMVNDEENKVIVAASTLEKDLKTKLKNTSDVEAAKAVGKLLAEKATKKKIKEAVFDRSGYLYHGRVKALADAAREGGLKF